MKGVGPVTILSLFTQCSEYDEGNESDQATLQGDNDYRCDEGDQSDHLLDTDRVTMMIVVMKVINPILSYLTVRPCLN